MTAVTGTLQPFRGFPWGSARAGESHGSTLIGWGREKSPERVGKQLRRNRNAGLSQDVVYGYELDPKK